MLKKANHLGVGSPSPHHVRSMSPAGGMSSAESIELKERSSLSPLLIDDVIETSRYDRKSPSSRNKDVKLMEPQGSGRRSTSSSRSGMGSAESRKSETSLIEPRQISVASFHSSEDERVTKRKSKRKTGERRPDDDIIYLDNPNHSSPRSGSRTGSRDSLSWGLPSLRSTSSLSYGDEEMDFFCADHMELLSNRALKEDHSQCEHIVPVEEWAEAQKMERERLNTETLLKKIDVFAGMMVEDRMEMKASMNESKEAVVDQFLDMVEDLVTELLKKQKDFTDKLDEMHESNIKNINGQIKRCTMIQRETSSCLSELEACLPNSDAFRAIKRKAQEKCPIYEEILRRDFNTSIRLDYEFVPSKTAETVFDDVESLGEISLRSTPSKLPGFMSMSTVSQFAERTIGKSEWIEARSSRDGKSCCLSGCAFLPNRRMVVADWSNTSVKLVNMNGSVVSSLTLPNNPWDVKQIDDSNLVVTVPGDKKIFIIEYTKDELKELTSFSTDCECWGVASFDDKFAVTCDPWSKAPRVNIYKNTGRLLSFFQKDVRGEMIFKYPEHITTDSSNKTLFISDSRAHKVIAITLKGENVFRYHHEKLVGPAGLVADSQGNVYVCGKDSHNVHQISKTGEHIQILLDEEEVENPRAICFEPSGESIMLTDSGPKFSDEVLVAKFR